MRKRTKILTVLLALMLAVALTQTALVQAFATEAESSGYTDFETATPDEPEKGITVTSFEITKSPEVLTYYKDYPAGWKLFNGLEALITFSDGTTFDYKWADGESYEEIIEEKGLYDTYDDPYLHITTDLESLPLGENTITYELCGCTDTQVITVSETDPKAIVKVELTKLPDKVFTAPYFTGERPDFEDEGYDDFFKDLDDNNSIAKNMKGAELTFYLKNGEKQVYVFDELGYYKCGLGTYNYYLLSVTDLGDYKARLYLNQFDYGIQYEQEFTVNHTGSEPSDNPATPGSNGEIKPSENGNTAAGTATADTATNDTAAKVTGNGTVATGSAAAPIAIISALVLACGVLFVTGRKRIFK